MIGDKGIKMQINEYHKLEEPKAENIILADKFVVVILIEKLSESWKNYKNHLKHNQKQLPLTDLITHIIIEDTNRKESKTAKAKSLVSQSNLVQNNTHNKSHKKRHHKRNENPSKAYLAEGDDIIIVVIAQTNIVNDMNKWIVHSKATRHICANKDAFTSYTTVRDDKE
ncbi:hypothetical protein KIW84_013949 [Lathyrus oleraceus]|uniref:Uncharacterized protein n=1 Tax=Pisum sativum TaxID=3888 RepID=A0A9D5BLH7_PEA|nr:hypothetical protein KIW84_013949 [Pisum sativum]